MRDTSAAKPKAQSQLAEFYSEEELAADLELSVHTLRFWRRRGIGPPVTKFNNGSSRVLYRRESVAQWLRESERRSSGHSRQVRAHAR